MRTTDATRSIMKEFDSSRIIKLTTSTGRQIDFRVIGKNFKFNDYICNELTELRDSIAKKVFMGTDIHPFSIHYSDTDLDYLFDFLIGICDSRIVILKTVYFPGNGENLEHYGKIFEMNSIKRIKDIDLGLDYVNNIMGEIRKVLTDHIYQTMSETASKYIQ